MITSCSFEVFRDRLTDVRYRQVRAFRPVAMLTADGSRAQEVIQLQPVSTGNLFPDAPAWDRLGYEPGCLGQDVVVTPEVLASRFESLGTQTFSEDLEQAQRELEAENRDFNDRQWVASTVRRYLQSRDVASQLDVLHYVLLKEYERAGAAPS